MYMSMTAWLYYGIKTENTWNVCCMYCTPIRMPVLHCQIKFCVLFLVPSSPELNSLSVLDVHQAESSMYFSVSGIMPFLKTLRDDTKNKVIDRSAGISENGDA